MPSPQIVRLLASLVLFYLAFDSLFGFGYLIAYTVFFVGTSLPGFVVLWTKSAVAKGELIADNIQDVAQP